MTTGTVIFTLAHMALFIYTRVKYIRKYKAASKELAQLQIEIMQLQSINQSLSEAVEQLEID